MKRRDFIAAFAGAAAWPLAARAQQRADIPRIGFLGIDPPSVLKSRVEALREGLHDLGYTEGKNIVVHFRYADGNYDRLPALASELIDLKVDLLATQGSPATIVAKRATRTIPIVMTVVGDAVAQGIVDSLARPGGNITGVTWQLPELNTKRLEILKEAVPSITEVAVLANPNNSSTNLTLKAMESAARSMKVGLYQVNVRQADEFAGAFSMIASRRIHAFVATDDAMMIASAKTIADLATMYRLPSAGFKELTDAGGLLAYGPNRLGMYRRAAYFVDRIIKGEWPAEIPVEQPAKFDLVVNLKTARILGLMVSRTLYVAATEIIE